MLLLLGFLTLVLCGAFIIHFPVLSFLLAISWALYHILKPNPKPRRKS